ncbi:unnamed protein product [Phytophthora lilii]|uniref:Unnamed protein product n=1 Tax=Phytophthora lilii TaxID=2077276 RepID=A0A9W6TJQ2_9STRA|nr:unnamed protein product [Phytophthora lilii]
MRNVLRLLSALLAVVCPAEGQAPGLQISFPAQHSWWQVSNDEGLLPRLPVYFQTQNFHIPEDGFLFVTGSKVPEEGYRQTARANSLVISDVGPGTQFWKLELRSWNDSSVAEATLHVEVVVDPSDQRSPLRYRLKDKEKRPTVLVNLKRARGSKTNSSGEVLPVCFVSSSVTGFDGQRRMWLQIMRGLSSDATHDAVKLQFAVKTFDKVVADAPLAVSMREMNVSLRGLPLEFPLARDNSRLISMQDQPALLQLDPPYTARVWTDVVNALRSPCANGVIVFSNSRSISDELLVLAARLAGVKGIVMEFANLFPTPVEVDVLLAPSHFAMEHFSVVRNVHSRHKVVLSTAVNVQQFKPAEVLLSDDKEFVIGYVGRLAPEKSIGVLLAMMRILSPLCSHCRLRVIGDGPQKAHLQSLAAEWGLLDTKVDFANGIFNDDAALLDQLHQLHAFASPMFVETLGIAVLEAMSAGIPVVGFISAGTTEFLEDNVNCVAVTNATPEKFAEAVLKLVNNSELRLRLGRQARRTVTERFSTQKGLSQYARLYERIGPPVREISTGRRME